MDLSNLRSAAETAKIDVYHPQTGEVLLDESGEPMWIEVYSVDSSHYRKIDQRIVDRNLTRALKSGGRSVNADQLVAQEWERLTASVKSWHIVYGGEVPDCTPAKVREVMEALPWLREQAESAMKDRAHFFGT